MLTVNELKTAQTNWNLIVVKVESNFSDYSGDFRLTGDTAQNLESSGLSGRVDSP